MRLRLLTVVLLFAAAAGAQEAASTVIVPVVGTMIGPGVLWKTDVDVVNDNGGPVDVAMELVTAPDDPVVLFDLGPGESRHFPDILQMFGIPFTLSPLRVTSSARRALTVRATVYGLHDGIVSKPQPIAVYRGHARAPLHPVVLSDDLERQRLHGGDRDDLARDVRLCVGDRQRAGGAFHRPARGDALTTRLCFSADVRRTGIPHLSSVRHADVSVRVREGKARPGGLQHLRRRRPLGFRDRGRARGAILKVPIVIGIAGGTGSGKTTVARSIYDRVGRDRIEWISHDSYYRNFD